MLNKQNKRIEELSEAIDRLFLAVTSLTTSVNVANEQIAKLRIGEIASHEQAEHSEGESDGLAFLPKRDPINFDPSHTFHPNEDFGR